MDIRNGAPGTGAAVSPIYFPYVAYEPIRRPSFCDRVGDVAKNVFDFMKHWSGPCVLGLGFAAFIFADASVFLALTGLALIALSIPLILVNYLSQNSDLRTRLIYIQDEMKEFQKRLTARINGTDTSAEDDISLHPFKVQIQSDIRNLARELRAVSIVNPHLARIGTQAPNEHNYDEIENLYKQITERIQIHLDFVNLVISHGFFGLLGC